MLALMVAGVMALGAPHGGKDGWPPADLELLNIAAPRVLGDQPDLPIVVEPFVEHVRGVVADASAEGATGIAVGADGKLTVVATPKPTMKDGQAIRAEVALGGVTWRGTDTSLYRQEKPGGAWTRHESYGIDGPLATQITALAADSKGTLWIGTPLGITLHAADGSWRHVRGTDGLPVEDVTALAIDEADRVWIGTSRGAVLYRPYETGRQWFYRAGKRYLPGDRVLDIALAPGGMPAYFLTDGGIGRIDAVTTTLLEKALIIERRVNERHRRLGLVAECNLDDAENPTSHTIGDNDNDGLWTAYHVAAMALCYGTTKDEAAKASAQEGMRALYMLENASGTPGLVARSVVPAEIGKTKDAQWRPTPDGKMYWKSDTSSDEIDGHYLAFYAYYEHIAQYDKAEKALLDKQVRAVTDYIVDSGYRLIDWDGKRTRWGFWDPESLNGNAADYSEMGLNSLQMLSFLKVAHYVTGDKKYERCYRDLIVEHGYLDNVMLTKKSFPDENNHSDDQLGFVAWYPILQLEKDPKILHALLVGVRRHYEVVRPEQPSFYTFVLATVDPARADFAGAIENLRQIPKDRRHWAMINSHRADVVFAPRVNRFGEPILLRALPADERDFAKWNRDPYEPDQGGDGRHEDDGAAYLLPYWMGRYHGFIAEP
ncbi:MAG TPA: two-component regulator propeller domain-containing protein [Candidatus Hydrogenedentes bacterium]|nr:two-component regulator propeller domain-containing protein [Candidatus Hydrogenedentota bacterium]